MRVDSQSVSFPRGCEVAVLLLLLLLLLLAVAVAWMGLAELLLGVRVGMVQSLQDHQPLQLPPPPLPQVPPLRPQRRWRRLLPPCELLPILAFLRHTLPSLLPCAPHSSSPALLPLCTCCAYRTAVAEGPAAGAPACCV